MFNSSNNQRKNKNMESGHKALTIIGADCIVNGDLLSEKPIRLDGKVVGTIQSGDSLIIGENGEIEGEIRSNHTVIYGTVKGDIFAQKLEIRKEGKVSGNITSQMVEMEAGAQYSGEMKITSTHEQEQLLLSSKGKPLAIG